MLVGIERYEFVRSSKNAFHYILLFIILLFSLPYSLLPPPFSLFFSLSPFFLTIWPTIKQTNTRLRALRVPFCAPRPLLLNAARHAATIAPVACPALLARRRDERRRLNLLDRERALADEVSSSHKAPSCR